jgi:hypothetical protein
MYEISAPITTINVSIYNVFVFTVPQYFNWNGRGRGDGGRVRATMKAVFALVEHISMCLRERMLGMYARATLEFA